MKRTKTVKWLCIAAFTGGCLLQGASCGNIWRQSIVNGTLQWVTGAVGSSAGTSAALTDILLNVLSDTQIEN
jgi:hypothetical protein